MYFSTEKYFARFGMCNLHVVAPTLPCALVLTFPLTFAAKLC